ncbi:unnamed protein product [Microthlaspi erraticum]|uniref:Uncharacterized protein n=1 Tax=Microthlaspi erraticum TaxID=1685480 RepID=A0A6D2IFU5_9BRAS|nr:unnamed protein product [Microthlaspi erraticum]
MDTEEPHQMDTEEPHQRLKYEQRSHYSSPRIHQRNQQPPYNIGNKMKETTGEPPLRHTGDPTIAVVDEKQKKENHLLGLIGDGDTSSKPPRLPIRPDLTNPSSKTYLRQRSVHHAGGRSQAATLHLRTNLPQQ